MPLIKCTMIRTALVGWSWLPQKEVFALSPAHSLKPRPFDHDQNRFPLFNLLKVVLYVSLLVSKGDNDEK